MTEIVVTADASGAAYVGLTAGVAPEVRDSVALDELGEAARIPALEQLVLDFDFYGRLVGIRVTGAADSVLSPSLLQTG